MPYVINGIGTWYYGKKDRMRVTDTCRHCGRTATLESYETREYFVVLFIPVIPLRRYKILDSCSACQKHNRLPATEYEQALRADVDAAKEAAAANSEDVDALERLCAVQLAYHQPEGARKAFRVLVEKCPDRATAHYGYASALQGAGEKEAAIHAYERALELEPALDAAAVEYANMLWGMKRPAEALGALKSRMHANWDSPAFLSTLGDHATWAKEYSTAAQAFGRMLELIPELANDRDFMKNVQKARKKAGIPLS